MPTLSSTASFDIVSRLRRQAIDLDVRSVDTVIVGVSRLVEFGSVNGQLFPAGEVTGDMSGQNDEFRHLLKEVQSGSNEATRELIENYGPHIIRAVRRKLNKAIRPKFDSIDFVQAVWASFFAAPKPLTDFRGPGDLVGYLAALAHHKVIDEIRRRMESEKYNVNREQSLSGSVQDMSGQYPDSQPSPSQVAVAEELWARMNQGKSEDQQRMLQLRREGYSLQQIADQLGVSEKTVRRAIKIVSPEQDS